MNDKGAERSSENFYIHYNFTQFAMYLLIFLEILLVVAIILMFIMKRKITSLLRENVKLHEKIYQLRNKGNEKALPGGHSHWEIVEPSELSYLVKEKDITRMN